MGTETTQEKRIRRLEDMLNALKGILEGIKHKLGQVAENDSRDTKPPSSGSGGARRFFAQANGTILAATGNAMGTGSAFLLQLIDGVRYQRDPEVSVSVLSTSGTAIGTFSYLELIKDDGVYSVVVANCVAVPAPTKAPPPPEPEGGA